MTADALNGPLTGNVTGTADKAIADGSGNNIVNTYVTKSGLASSVTTATGKVTTLTATDNTLTNVTITGETSVPTANAGNSSKAIANTEFVAKSIADLVNGAPDQLNTLNELARALGNDANFSATITAELAKKLNSAEAESTYATKQEAANISTGLTQAETRISAAVPTGVVQAFAGSATPQGWLLCDGSAVSRTDYAALFAVIGTTYGAGDRSTTFNLPNLVDKFVEGSATSGTVKSAGLPNITGYISFRTIASTDNNLMMGKYDIFPYTGSFYKTTKSWSGSHSALSVAVYSPYDIEQLNMDASLSNSVYGNSNTVQPPALTMRYIIKY